MISSLIVLVPSGKAYAPAGINALPPHSTARLAARAARPATGIAASCGGGSPAGAPLVSDFDAAAMEREV
jgi:hypothetical protein